MCYGKELIDKNGENNEVITIGKAIALPLFLGFENS